MDAKGLSVIKLNNTSSTNLAAKQFAHDGASHGTLVIASTQSSGRGRLGRQFFSYKGGLYMSLILRPTMKASDVMLITAAAAVATAEVLEEVSCKKCDIKWVNDIYSGGKKVCGILTEGGITSEGRLDYAILGIGANLARPCGGFPKEITEIADCLFERTLSDDEIENTAILIANRFFSLYEGIENRTFLQEYRRRSMLIGKTVSYNKDGEFHEAVAVGIDRDARLITKENGQEILLGAGEVSVKW